MTYLNNNDHDQMGMVAFDDNLHDAKVNVSIGDVVTPKHKPRPTSILGECCILKVIFFMGWIWYVLHGCKQHLFGEEHVIIDELEECEEGILLKWNYEKFSLLLYVYI